jgi:peptidoglycan hydrolase CwlO-like protein
MRDQIKQGRQAVKGLEERRRLAEDELSLLQVQQASELSPDTQSSLAAQIKDKNVAVSGLRQDIDKAKKEIEKLEKDFKAQGGTLEEKKK